MDQIEGGKPVRPTASTGFMERAMGIEPTSEAWEARDKLQKRWIWRRFYTFRAGSIGK
jgi:hypothetical protein